MKAGLIGEKLTHSLSPDIHRKFYTLTGIDGSYSLYETPRDMLGDFINRLEAEGFDGFNVTIPYKTEIIKYLDGLSEEAEAIGAVNTMLFRDGKRRGYNTDYFGLKTLIEYSGIKIRGKRAVILGTGGAARCAQKLLRDMGAGEVIATSRSPEKADLVFSAMSYKELESIPDIDLLINTTPSGMYPDVSGCPASESIIEKCGAVIDIIYNPYETVLMAKARERGIPATGGLMMLCAQAVKAQEIWNGRIFGEEIYSGVYFYMRRKSENANIVLIGMPGSGKTSVGREAAKRLGIRFADTDSMIEEKYGSIPDIFASRGEAVFRNYEHEAALEATRLCDTVISTGGGIILGGTNMEALKKSGIIIYIDRPLDILLAETDTSGRPLLAGGAEAIKKLYYERRALYEKYADIVIDNSGEAESCIADILRIFQ